jgi:hypothetical protein
MNRKRLNIVFLIITVFAGSSIFLTSYKGRSMEGMLIATQSTQEMQDIDYSSGNSWRYLPGSRIVVFNADKPEKSLKILTKGYFSACSPEISYDNKFMIFAAQKNPNDIWQIYEMNLENLKIRQVTASKENCIDPAYLPGNRIVFSKDTMNDTVKSGHSLFTCNLDGSKMERITYNPNTYFASTVMQDGRVLTISRQLYPNQKDGKLMVLRPDGSKAELFYQGSTGHILHSGAEETNNGKLIFIESQGRDKKGGNIISINYNRPLHSRLDLSSGIGGDFYSIGQLATGKLLVCYRSNEKDRYALYEFDMENKTLGKSVYKDKNYNILDVVVINKKGRPKNLPSDVDRSKNTGLLLCQDVNFSELQFKENTSSSSKAIKMEVIGIDSSLGIVDVEKDGSFYLKVLADTPFRIQTIDDQGDIVNGPGSWIYLRPNERRGCVGCHENKEQVPENRQPLSVRKDPIILPAQMEQIHENEDSLK